MEQEFWFNTKTKEVEQGKQVSALYRIGPFRSAEEAKRAYEIIAERNKELDKEED